MRYEQNITDIPCKWCSTHNQTPLYIRVKQLQAARGPTARPHLWVPSQTDMMKKTVWGQGLSTPPCLNPRSMALIRWEMPAEPQLGQFFCLYIITQNEKFLTVGVLVRYFYQLKTKGKERNLPWSAQIKMVTYSVTSMYLKTLIKVPILPMYVNETMAFMILNNQVVLALKWCCSEALINIPYTCDGYTVIQTPWQVQSPWRVVWLLVIGFNPALIGRNLRTHIHHAPRHGRMTGTQVEYTQRFILSLSPLCVWTGRGYNFL